MTNNQASPTAGKVHELFEETRRFTEDLLAENEKLRLLVASIRTEKRDIESQYVRVDVPHLQNKVKLLEEEVAALRDDNEELRGHFNSVEEENREFADRYVQVERQNSDLVNLYVASYRLHSTLAYVEVVAIIKEIVINMIGSEMFGVYVMDEREQRLVLIAHEGMEETAAESIPLGEGRLGEVGQSGELYCAPPETELHNSDEPIACIPLKVGDQVLGVIGIYRLLLQKDGFAAVDFELFELLGGHAATALYVSKLYGLSERKRSTLEGFIELLRTNGDDDG